MFPKPNSFNNNKKSIINDIEKHNQRRESRKINGEKMSVNLFNQQNIAQAFDRDYAKMIIKKQTEIYQNSPKKV